MRMNFSLTNNYEAFSFANGKPTNVDILLMGFKNFQEAFYFIILAAVFTLTGTRFIKNQMVKNDGKNRIVKNSLVLTFLLAFLYMGYKLIYGIGFDRAYFNVYWKDIKNETVTLFISYLLISIPITFFGSKQIAKRPEL